MDNTQDVKEAGNMSDHDLLITLNTKFNWLRGEIKNNQDGIGSKLADHELRLNAIEKVHDEVDPAGAIKLIKSHDEWIHDFKITYRNIILLTGGIASVITFILTVVSKL